MSVMLHKRNKAGVMGKKTREHGQLFENGDQTREREQDKR